MWVEPLKLDPLIAEFGWSLKRAAGFDQLRELSIDEQVIAVLLDANTLHLSWAEALRSVLQVDSKALPIVCHGFSDRINWPQLAGAGAYHSLWLPLDPGEVRQSLAFVWAAKNRHSSNVISLRPVDRAKYISSGRHLARSASSAA
jgi:DNA-binding NtrC family response regulator